MSGEQTIDYEALTQDAMRGVVRAVLTRAVKSGLPGDHHFYISFDTQAPGVILSKRLKENEKYKQEMTIVLQHRFWDLAVNDERFEVKLTFDGIPERLVVPFQAIKVFFDPSVRFGLQFEDPDAGSDGVSTNDDDADARPIPGMPHPTTTRSQGPRKPRAARKPRAERDGTTPPGAAAARSTGTVPPVAPATLKPTPTAATPAAVQASPPAAPAGRASPPQTPAVDTPPAAKEEQKPAAPAAAGAQIVSLDQFRNKK